MTEKGEGPVKVVAIYPPFGETGYEVNLYGVNLRFFSMSGFGEHARTHAEKYQDQINRALSPLVARAEMAETMAAYLRGRLSQGLLEKTRAEIESILSAWSSLQGEKGETV